MSYTRGTFAALVDAVVPETPTLDDRGDEHVPGGLAADLDAHLVEAFDDLAPGDGGGTLAALGLEASVSTIAALLLDLAALELLVRRRARGSLQSPDERFAAGPFSRLERRDRLRAVQLLETDGVLSGSDDLTYLAGLFVPLTQTAYYSDWGGDEQGWAQADYPGPADGYAVSMGYEVAAFEDGDWASDGLSGDGTDPSDVSSVRNGDPDGVAGDGAVVQDGSPDQAQADAGEEGDDWTIEDPDPTPAEDENP